MDDQTTQVAGPLAATAEEMVTLAKAEEETAIIEEPGIVADVDLANVVYTIPEVARTKCRQWNRMRP